LTSSATIQRWGRTVVAIVAVALATGNCAAYPGSTPAESLGNGSPGPTPSGSLPPPTPKFVERAQAIAVAEDEAAGNSATPPVLLDAKREVLNCHPQPCPEVWTVSFAVTDASGKRGHTTVEIDAASGTLMYSDWSWP
jgi:hypothetical protein